MESRDQKSFKFWQELKRRNVLRVLAIYAGTAFIILEAADLIFPRWGLPDWTVDLVLYLLLLGAVITFILSWIYDLSPEGIVKTAPGEVDRHEGDGGEGQRRRTLVSNLIIALLIVVIGVLVYPKIFKNSTSPLNGKSQSSIAVLPLRLIGNDADLSFFASGLVETLTHMLSKVGNSEQSFSVIPPSEIVEAISAREARKRFGVSLVITGSIQMDQTSSRLILNLIDAKTQNLIRSEKVDYSREKNLILQDEVISVMVSMLGLELGAQTKEQLSLGGSSLYTANELYLTGRGILREGIETQKDIDDALDIFLSAIEKDSLFAMAYAGAAQAYTLKYHFTLDPVWNDESLKYSRKAVELNDKDAYALMSLASSLVEQGKLDEALVYYERSREIDSSRAGIYHELAYLYEMQGQIEKAEQYYHKAIELDPDSHLTHYYLGGFLFAQARFKEAMESFQKALKFSPGHLTIMHAIASCSFELDNFEKAKGLFEEILEQDSAQGQVLSNLGHIYFYQGDYAKSVDYYQKACTFTPNNYSVYGSLGRAYLFWNKQDLAIESFREAIKVGRQDILCSDLNFATWFGLMGMQDSAYFYLSRYNPSDNPGDLHPTASFILGELYLILERDERALPYLESALERGAGWKDVRYSPLFKALREDNKFRETMAEAAQKMNQLQPGK